MKKILLGVALVAFALSAHATKVTWGLATGNALDTEKIATGTMYLVYASDATKIDWTKFSGQESFSTSTIASAGFDKTIDSFDYSSSSVSKTSTITPTSSGLTGSQSFYVVCLSDAGDYVAYSPTAQTAAISNSSMTLGKTQLSSAFTYVGTAAVPEPTSGLLMLLGMAGLALKRKRA